MCVTAVQLFQTEIMPLRVACFLRHDMKKKKEAENVKLGAVEMKQLCTEMFCRNKNLISTLEYYLFPYNEKLFSLLQFIIFFLVIIPRF